MTKRILRSFLYLDEAIVEDYLAQYEGAILEGPYTTTDTSTGSKEGSGGIKFALAEGSGKGASSTSSAISQTFRETSVAKFTKLYDYLKADEAIQPLYGFDESIYEQIQPGEIIEVRGIAKLPQWEHLARTVSDFSGLIEVMKAIGQDPLADDSTKQAYQGFTNLIAKKSQEKIDLIVAPIGSPKFKFVAQLDIASLRRKDNLETEVSILGKVQRKLARGEVLDIFRVLPRIEQIENLNRVQRRSAGKKTTDSPLDEVVRYPAMQIQTIAVYQ